MPEKLTVLIPCKNEEKNIRLCIESVKSIADEILVADSGSTDRTIAIARELGGRVIEREYIYSADFKNWAIPQAKHDWVLIVDSDERVTPELAEEIKTILSGTPEHDGYRIPFRTLMWGHEIRHCGWNRDRILRFFRRDVGRYEDIHVHAGLLVSTGRVGQLKGKFEHYTYWSLEQYFKKTGRYSTWAAEDLYKKGRRPGFLTLSLRPAWRFFQHYILQLGIFDGRRGLIISGLGAFYVFTKYAKLWVMYYGRPQPDPEAEREQHSSS